MKRRAALRIAAISAAVALALTGCSNTARSTGTASSGGGFDKGATIGVALPTKTSANWVLAGGLFTSALEKAGFKSDVQYAGASGAVADQQSQIQSMITEGAKVIIIGAVDGGQLAAQAAAAQKAGITVISYDRLIVNTKDVDYYIGFNATKVGELQGQALLDGMKAKYPDKKTYNIELFSGSPDDANSAIFFDGAMSVLQPKIDDGTLKVVSGQTAIKQTSTQGWLPANAQTRMDTLLAANYKNTELDGVLSPNDTLARAILTSVKSAGKPNPIVTGQDSEPESVKLIMQGVQYSTINKDTSLLVDANVAAVQALQAGDKPAVNDTKSFDNGAKVMQSVILEPVIVTKENAVEAYKNVPDLEAIAKQYSN